MGNGLLPLIGFPSPDDFVKGFFSALQSMFGNSVRDSIAQNLKDLSENVPSLDRSSIALERYDGMFAVALALGAVAAALQLLRMIKLADWESFVDFAKIVPLTFFFGTMLPYVTYIATDFLGDIQHGIVKSLLHKPLDENTFAVVLSGGFSPYAMILGWLGSGELQLENYVMVKFLSPVMMLLVLVFALRWFGMLGDGLFTVTVGIFLTLIFGNLSMTLMLCLFYMGFSGPVPPMALSFAIFFTATTPLVFFVLYFKAGFAQKVKGVMDTRQINTRISSTTAGGAGGGSGVAGKVASAAGGAVVGALLARESGGGRPEGVNLVDHHRNRMSDRMMQSAMLASRSNPFMAAAMLGGSKLLKTHPKPTPEPHPMEIQAPPLRRERSE